MFEKLIDDKFLKTNDKLAVGVSGGADSMLLLWALLDKQKQIGFEMTVVHVNHHIRKETSDRDQKFVEEFCKKRKINQITIEINVKKHKNGEKYTLEEAARLQRYEAFEKVMKENKLNKLALAHHKNDQAETILMHIFRGSGIAGASGIRQTDKIIRPLINLSKSEILKICKEYKIDFVEDETNFENEYARNYLRNEIFPAIEKIYPNAVDNIAKFGLRCAEVQNYIESQVNDDLIVSSAGEVLLKDGAFNFPTFIIREYIKTAFEKLKIFEDIEAKHYVMIYDLQKCEVGKQVDLPKKCLAKRTYQGIKFLKKKNNDKNVIEQEFIIGEIDLGRLGKIKTKIISADDVVYGNETLFIDYNKISNDAVWRTRKLGDIFAKLGTGSKKLNDYFTDKKIDSDKRDFIPVLALKNQVLVVAGEDISENVKIDSQTDKIIAIDFLKN